MKVAGLKIINQRGLSDKPSSLQAGTTKHESAALKIINQSELSDK
jgi:hypothetical protein